MRVAGRQLTLAIAALGLFLFNQTATADDDLPLTGHTTKLEFETTEGSWLSIDVMPDGSHLIFDLLGDLYTLPIDGGEATRITSGLGFDSQPTVSPDGKWLAFVSDRSGSNNLWITRPDGSNARKLSDESQWGVISPAWTPDSQFVVVTITDKNTKLAMYHIDGGSGLTLSGSEDDEKWWGVGVEIADDGRSIYMAQEADSNGPVESFPAAQIFRYDLQSGHSDQLTRAEGGAFRPALSPDGNLLAYGTRSEAQTGLRIRNLATGDDRWLSYPIQRDSQENFRPGSRDVLPGYTFTPDGQSVIFNAEGKIWQVSIDSGERNEIPFSAAVSIDIGPDLTNPYRVPQGEFTATLIQDPQSSPDGRRLASSILTKIYVSDKRSGATPERLTNDERWEYKPVWSPDGRWIAFVSWSMNDGGHVFRMRSNGSGRVQQLTSVPAFYTDLAFSPDGDRLYAMRGSEYMRHQKFSEFTGLEIPLELVSLPADGGEVTVLSPARGARDPHFGANPERLFLLDEDGLFSIKLDGSDHRRELIVTGPRGNRRGEDPPPAEVIRMSPTGQHALALVNKQVFVMPVTRVGGEPPTIDVRKGALPVAQLTHIGADFLGWAGGGETIWWAIGNSYFERSLASIDFHDSKEGDDDEADESPLAIGDEHEAVERIDVELNVARDTPRGSLLLRGANVIAMTGDSSDEMNTVLVNQDILITDNRIIGIGDQGTLDTPTDATSIDLNGKYVVPGFIDTHAHWEFRTGDVLEPQNWSLTANLAYGVTAGLDVQTAYKEYLAYRDFVESGQSVGQRAFMTARGIFGNNDFQSYDETRAYLRRYIDHYHTRNIKSYLVGNRKQRQWIVLASKELGLMPTTEGGADQKMNLTHAIDGMHGNEHTLPDSPLHNDVVQLFAQTRTAYTPTLIVQYNAEVMREYFFTRTEVHDNEKLQRFYPHNRLDELTQRRPGWQRDSEFQFAQAAAQALKIQRAGGLVGVGGHAELQGLGYHWEMWAYEMGGLQPVEVLRAATIDGAHIIGVADDLGSLEAGKLADMVILNDNPLENIRSTAAIDAVIKNGRLYDGDTLDERWPSQTPLAPFWWWDENDRRHSTSALPQ